MPRVEVSTGTEDIGPVTPWGLSLCRVRLRLACALTGSFFDQRLFDALRAFD